MQREESAEQTVDLLAGKFAFRSIEVDCFFLTKNTCKFSMSQSLQNGLNFRGYLGVRACELFL